MSDKANKNGIKQAFLQWVGKEHYPTIVDYVNEAKAMGVSKRLPSIEVAQTLSEPGTVVFLAHDEGNYSECPDCVGNIECPDCRKNRVEYDRKKVERDGFQKKTLQLIDAINEKSNSLADATKNMEDVKESLGALGAEHSRNQAKIAKRHQKMEELLKAQNECKTCNGMGKLLTGTGGKAVFNNGVEYDYVKYNYWLHQPQNWTPAELGGLKEDGMCQTCGGTGRLPQGKIFGMYLPSAIEYVLKPEDSELVKKEMEAKNIKVVVETAQVLKRGCGFRKAGGVYAVTYVKDNTKDAKKVVKELVEKGLVDPKEVKINGNFIEFLAPIEINSKRFRGIKKWSLDPDAEDQAEMALDALE
jgi:hypothetical protein